ncbi:hypothetical protein EGW08_013915 [Elysia chlorotica]|uniref:Uncharacterized protein n=1 Tax=Elysia chlorotica TaxID=188477 RepID=A0A3S1B9H6_ELYCH|nr:hypothetical protein EGW08_013915 [Elysia chlorotica]
MYMKNKTLHARRNCCAHHEFWPDVTLVYQALLSARLEAGHPRRKLREGKAWEKGGRSEHAGITAALAVLSQLVRPRLGQRTSDGQRKKKSRRSTQVGTEVGFGQPASLQSDSEAAMTPTRPPLSTNGEPARRPCLLYHSHTHRRLSSAVHSSARQDEGFLATCQKPQRKAGAWLAVVHQWRSCKVRRKREGSRHDWRRETH